MALLVFSNYPSLPFLSSSSSSSSSFSSSSLTTLAITASPFSRLHREFTGRHPNSFSRLQINVSFILKERSPVVVKAYFEVDGTVSGGSDPPSEGEEDAAVPFESLPLESKLQLKLEQKMRMKLGKKIRLRRKKLIRKRRMRKKGQWPPSKMKKNKNV